MAKLNKASPRMQKPTEKRAQVASDSWREGKSASKRGYDRKWRAYRLDYLNRLPYCRMCLQPHGLANYQNRSQIEAKLDVYALDQCKANVVDHIQAHRGDMDLFWDETNHQPLCKFHHDSVKQRQERMS